MLKLLIIAADSVEPSIIFNHRELFPNLTKMINSGASLTHSAYVQKGYNDSYSSAQNWASIYTGLTPKAHEINTNLVRGEKRRPQMKDFDILMPFWKVFNENNLSVGLWNADSCIVPEEINGYVVSTLYNGISTPTEIRTCERELQISEKDKDFIRAILTKNPPAFVFPKTLKQQGYRFEELKVNNKLAEEAIKKYHYEEGVELFEEDLKYWFEGIKKAQKERPVDIQFFYTGLPDLIAHFCMYCDNNSTLLEVYRILDQYIGELIEDLEPERIVFLSDHGQQNFSEIVKCSDPVVQKEAFAAKDEVIWLDNGYIVFEAHNGALLFTAHAIKGTFIAAGKGIKKTIIEDMRTLDIYSTILEMLDIKIPENRQGLVQDIFSKKIVNINKVLDQKHHKKATALLQTHAANIMDIVINEVYLEDRFRSITLVGEERYREIFLNNPRVERFIPFEQFHYKEYEEVFCAFFNKDSGEMGHIKI